MKFFGDGGPADLGAAFEHQRFESGFGEIEGGDQAVVSAADDDNVARVRPSAYAAPFHLSGFRARPDVRARP